MRGMAAITSFLDTMATFAERGANLLWNSEIFALDSHSIKPDGVAAFLKLLEFFLVALPTLLWKDHRLLFRGGLMIRVTRDAVDPLFCVL